MATVARIITALHAVVVKIAVTSVVKKVTLLLPRERPTFVELRTRLRDGPRLMTADPCTLSERRPVVWECLLLLIKELLQ